MEQNKVEVREVSSCKNCLLIHGISLEGENVYYCSVDAKLPIVDISQTEPPDQCPLREKNILITIKPQQ